MLFSCCSGKDETCQLFFLLALLVATAAVNTFCDDSTTFNILLPQVQTLTFMWVTVITSWWQSSALQLCETKQLISWMMMSHLVLIGNRLSSSISLVGMALGQWAWLGDGGGDQTEGQQVKVWCQRGGGALSAFRATAILQTDALLAEQTCTYDIIAQVSCDIIFPTHQLSCGIIKVFVHLWSFPDTCSAGSRCRFLRSDKSSSPHHRC